MRTQSPQVPLVFLQMYGAVAVRQVENNTIIDATHRYDGRACIDPRGQTGFVRRVKRILVTLHDTPGSPANISNYKKIGGGIAVV